MFLNAKILTRFLFLNSPFYYFYKFLMAFLRNIKGFKINSLVAFDSLTYHCDFGGDNRVYSGVTLKNCSLGRYTYIGSNSRINNTTIGAYCSIAQNVVIVLGSHEMKESHSTHPIFFSNFNQVGLESNNKVFRDVGEVNIGNDVWIGEKAIILDDIQVGDGAVIAAGAVVTKNVLPFQIVGGVPAKPIGMRFDDNTRKLLLSSKWWELDVVAAKKKLVGLGLKDLVMNYKV